VARHGDFDPRPIELASLPITPQFSRRTLREAARRRCPVKWGACAARNAVSRPAAAACSAAHDAHRLTLDIVRLPWTNLAIDAHSRRPFGVLGKRIRYLVPGCFGSHEDVFTWAHTRIIVQRSHHNLADQGGVHADKL
jgi:hypothetical protein